MAALDIATLLQPLSDDAPCGEDLEYDAQFMEMGRATEGTPETQFQEAEEPDWKDVRRLATAVLERTKDLRAVVFLSQALASLEGLPAFCEGLALIKGLLENFWDTVHPQLDAEDDNDPTFRINTLATLCDGETTLRLVKSSPIVRSRAIGQFCLRDVDLAKGDISPREGESVPSIDVIQAAFSDVDLEELKENAASIKQAVSDLSELERILTEQVGAASAISFSPLQELLERIDDIYSSQLKRLGVSEPVVEEDSWGAPEETTASNGSGGPAVVAPISGAIASRDDVILMLDKICEYYSKFEPSSPLPLLLRRCQKLATKNFLEILREIAPNGLDQVKLIGGVTDDDVSGASASSGSWGSPSSAPEKPSEPEETSSGW